MAGNSDLLRTEVHQPQERLPKTNEYDAYDNPEDQVNRNGERRDAACFLLPPGTDILGYRNAGADSDKAEHQNAEENNFVG
ncbi:hypothetical protein D3C81_1118300 [compost metagenome]